jgi:hypothetical protein
VTALPLPSISTGNVSFTGEVIPARQQAKNAKQ